MGDKIVCVVQRVRMQTAQQQARKQVTGPLTKVNRGDVRRAIVVRTKQQFQRKDGTVMRFDDNACVLIDEKGEPLGTRIMGIRSGCLKFDFAGLVAKELAEKQGGNKVMSLAPKAI